MTIKNQTKIIIKNYETKNYQIADVDCGAIDQQCRMGIHL